MPYAVRSRPSRGLGVLVVEKFVEERVVELASSSSSST
jgi:hypothetical protein